MSMTAAIDDDSRTLVTIETVTALTPIEDADFIEVAQVRGWRVVVKKGEFAVGDACVYFEIDSLLPLADDRFAFLAPRGEKVIDGVRYHRLKTARMRGVYSQGLLLPEGLFAAEFDDYCTESTEEMGTAYGMSFAEYLAGALGIVKYTEELPESAVGPFRPNTPKTSSERVQNLTSQWGAVLGAGPWVATEKIDGISCTAFCDPDGVLRVYGRNWEVADGDNPYWAAARKYRLADLLRPGTGIQFEIYGLGAGRKNRLGVGELRIAVFAYIVGAQVQPIHLADSIEGPSWPSWLLPHAVPVLDLQLPATAEEAIAQVEKLRSAINPAKQAEGVVWHQRHGRAVPALGFRTSMKAINNSYLVKNES